MKINEQEMQGLLSGKCLPLKIKTNESLASFFVRHFDDLRAERDAAINTINSLRELLGCKEGEDLSGRVCGLVAESVDAIDKRNLIMRHVYRSKTYLESSRVIDAIQGLQCAIEASLQRQEDTAATIREVKARGVEDFIDFNRKLAKDYPMAMVAKCLEITELNGEQFAARLRADNGGQ